MTCLERKARLSSSLYFRNHSNNMVSLWCCNMSEMKDPIDEVFVLQTIVLDLKWMIEEMPKLETIGESMIMLRETIGDEVLISTKNDISSSTRLREILLITGRERNPAAGGAHPRLRRGGLPLRITSQI